MPKMQAIKIELSEKEKKILKQFQVGTHSPLHLKIRSEIVLLASAGESNNAIERKMEIAPKTVSLWRNRYAKSREKIIQVESETPLKLRSTIEAVLSDEQRPGAPVTFTDEKVACIIALACKQPEELELPFSHWTPTLLQTEVIKMGIVDSISVMQISRFLKRERFKTAPNNELVKS